MNWTPHIVSVGIFVGAAAGIDHAFGPEWYVTYGGALVATWIIFALLGAPGVDLDE